MPFLVPELKKLGRLALLASLLTLTGCGFQLRGSSPVPAALQPLAIDCPASMPGQFCQSLREQLKLGGIELRDPGQSDYLLRLSDYRQDRRASAITAQAAAAEYILRHTVAMELVTRDQIPLIATTDLSASETYRYDETNVLAKQREEDELRQQLGDRLAQQVIFRLAPMSRQRIDALVQEHTADGGEPELP
ncbi:LPS assembly lipoprotein LptE [Marinobacter nauticus]|uniref:LPS-assembly lipoprotein LptE n=1 Tax=Marinobacter nauticus (strain ATCC 700491 / DSM 11845 / VT8) TaxID=351348 RepID=A1U4A1_MARN8|nr:LPS assembly lipoprotein LptE [Marinobacter nauticus]ABM19820.1 Rare lipoprotein B [Marinobacter nauticus VT8]